MKIAILLTCHNRKAKTISCLRNLYFQDYNHSDFEVYLVDDGCTDGTSEEVKLKFPKVNIINGNGELFWNRGMHLAWTTALNSNFWDAVLWLNDDTILEKNALTSIVNYAHLYEDSIIVGTTCSLDDDSDYTYGGYKEKNIILRPLDSAIKCNLFNGNIVLVPRAVSDRIGILDYKFRHSLGDFEYGLRANKNGIDCYSIPVVGKCSRNGGYVKWTDKKYNVFKRLEFLYSPLGNNPFESFYFLRNTSFRRAILVFIYLHCKAIFPALFPKRNSID